MSVFKRVGVFTGQSRYAPIMKALRGFPEPKKGVPFEFVLEALSGTDLRTRAMFGCTAVYVGEKICFVLCDREKMQDDIGIWVCIPAEHTGAMKAQFPELRGVSFFENENSAWQCLPASHPRFEELALEFCGLVRRGNPAIGRLPKSRPRRKKSAPAKAKPNRKR